MIERLQRFGPLEWLWVAHTVLWLAVGILFIASRNPACDIAVTSLALPLGIVVLDSPGYQALDEMVRVQLFAVILFLNGGLWYALLRFGPRSIRAVATAATSYRAALPAVGDFHRRWLRGELGSEPVWAHFLLIPAILWLGLGLYHPSAFLFTAGALVYCGLLTAVVLGETQRQAAPRPATGRFARMDRPGWLRAQRTAFRFLLGLFIAALGSGGYLAWATWIRGGPIDYAVATRLVNIERGFEAPSFHGDELVRLSAELPRYRRILNTEIGLGYETHARRMLATTYAQWRYDDEALFLFREGLKRGQLGPWGLGDLVLEAAFARDVSLFEASWKSLEGQLPPVSRPALERFVRGDIKQGVLLGLEDLEKRSDLPQRAANRLFLARVLAKHAPDPGLRGFAEGIFNAQLNEFLQQQAWSDFLAQYAADEHKYRLTVLFDEFVSLLGFAAEYYAKSGDDVKRDEWLTRLETLGKVMHEKREPRATWLEHLAQRAKNTAPVDTLKPRPPD